MSVTAMGPEVYIYVCMYELIHGLSVCLCNLLILSIHLPSLLTLLLIEVTTILILRGFLTLSKGILESFTHYVSERECHQ